MVTQIQSNSANPVVNSGANDINEKLIEDYNNGDYAAVLEDIKNGADPQTRVDIDPVTGQATLAKKGDTAAYGLINQIMAKSYNPSASPAEREGWTQAAIAMINGGGMIDSNTDGFSYVDSDSSIEEACSALALTGNSELLDAIFAKYPDFDLNKPIVSQYDHSPLWTLLQHFTQFHCQNVVDYLKAHGETK